MHKFEASLEEVELGSWEFSHRQFFLDVIFGSFGSCKISENRLR